MSSNTKLEQRKQVLNNMDIPFKEEYFPQVVDEIPGFHKLTTENYFYYFPDNSNECVQHLRGENEN